MTRAPSPARRRALRAPVALPAALAAVVLALSAAACGSSAPSGGSGHKARSAHVSGALAFARCMRSHGVQHWPDPGARGGVDKSKLTTQQLGVSASVIHAADKACQRLTPQSSQSAEAQNQEMMNAMWKFARCVRADGVTHWPDPLAESDPGQPGTPGFPRSMPGVDQNAPQVKAALKKCQHLMAGIGYASGGYP
jgi:hypothetical protein